MKDKYNHLEVEQNKYDFWLENNLFQEEDKSKEPFCIVLPPPNVTGKLHIGHALDSAIQDTIIRYKKLKGYDALWIPGMDHAAIATEARVVNRLKNNGINKYDLTREQFLDECWKWTKESSDTIRRQWAKLGLALDYSKERFTLDENLDKAVKETFVKMYNDGLIYQGEKIINWDPVAQTALSQEEVIYKEDTGAFYHLKYYLEDKSNYLEVATTRPETLFGDTAVAVNPDDERYKKYIGQKVILPITNELIPIVGDEHANPEFGTGVVKITPAHDPNDYEVGLRHNLERKLVIKKDGTMNEHALHYNSLDRFECRKQLIKELKEKDLLIKIEEIKHAVGHSERTDAVVEPYLSKQWFVKMRPLADALLNNQSDKKNKINFVPSRYEKIMNHWMEITYDWCISRQLYWGHRIPVWYKEDEIYVGVDAPKGDGWVQDNDVLDTWFSSALWPFATLQWPDNDELLKRYYPNNVLCTGYDIIPFWVNRMAFQGLYLTGQKPFNDVLIHGLVRDEQGRKMTKSLGNGVDPMDVIQNYGSDSMRWFLLTTSAIGLDIRYSEEKIKASWNFCNKIWNASRYVLANIENTKDIIDFNSLKEEDEWILSKYNDVVKIVNKSNDKYNFNVSGQEIYNFFWNDFCDWYIELAKINMDNNKKAILHYLLKNILIMIHPFMPHITEEIYQLLPEHKISIMVENHPKYDKKIAYSSDFANTINLITNIRKEKLERNIKEFYIISENKKIKDNINIIKRLTKLTELVSENENKLFELTFNFEDGKVILLFDNSVNKEAEEEKLNLEKEKLENSIARRRKLLSNEGYVNKAPVNIVEKERQDLLKEENRLKFILDELSK